MQMQSNRLSDLKRPPHLHRRVTSIRSRRANLTDAQVQLTGPQPPRPVDTNAWFGRSAPVVLEIGCGTGTTTVAMAKEEPHIDVVAVEVYKRGLAQLLGGLDVLEHMFGTESLAGVRVFFPDPWPKSRHHKRRLLQPCTVELIADRL